MLPKIAQLEFDTQEIKTDLPRLGKSFCMTLIKAILYLKMEKWLRFMAGNLEAMDLKSVKDRALSL